MEINEDVIKYYFKLNKDLIQCCQKANTDNLLTSSTIQAIPYDRNSPASTVVPSGSGTTVLDVSRAACGIM